MKRFLLAVSLVLCLAPQAHARGILVLMDDSLYTASGSESRNNMAPFFDLLSRSLKPGMKMAFVNQSGSAAASQVGNYATYTLTDLMDNIYPTAAAPTYDYDLIIALQMNCNVTNTARRYPVQLSRGANRPRVPVLYISPISDLTSCGNGDDSLGVNGGHVNVNLVGSLPWVTSPAGYAFPVNTYFSQRLGPATVAGPWVTPVLWLQGYQYTKADPDGQGGVWSGSPSAADTMCAWFYNPPILTTRPLANTAGYGVINYEPGTSNGGTSNAPSGQLAAVAVGMAAKLAPAIFKFPAVQVALDIDDGCKRFSNASSLPQVLDALAGLDSLGVAKIPFTYGIEVDSMGTPESNGLSRFQNEFTAVRRYGYGHVTVHCHRGFSNAQGGSSAGIADSTLASAATHQHVDVLGSKSQRYALVGTSAATKDASVLSLLDDATKQLIDYAGGSDYVSREVMAPTDDWSTITAKSGVNLSNMDSVMTALAIAGSGYKGFPGYRVVRTQFQANTYNINEVRLGTGGVQRGFVWQLPNLYATASALGAGYRPTRGQSILLATSRYLWGTTTDTTSADDYGAMRFAASILLSEAEGFNRNYNMTTSQESNAGTNNSGANRGYCKGVIWVTHLPNWRQGIGITTPLFGGGRPAWDNVRMVHGAMEAAKWCALQANTSTTTYFKDGPMKWQYSGGITAKDLQ